MPDKVCLMENTDKITYKELYKNVSRFADFLKSKGIKVYANRTNKDVR